MHNDNSTGKENVVSKTGKAHYYAQLGLPEKGRQSRDWLSGM